jgi:hypothetical protein
MSSKASSENARLISMRERLVLLLALSTTIVGTYIYLNNNPVFAPQLMPMTAVDTATPFLVWTVWPYAFLNLSNGIMPFFVRRRDDFLRMALTLAIAMGIHIVFWTFWPTTFPRPPVPMGDSISEHFYGFLIVIDAPVNCFPSAHVAAPAVQLFFVCRAWPKLAPWLWTVFGLFALSILTTKQHYSWDLLGAAVIVFIALKMTSRMDSRRED